MVLILALVLVLVLISMLAMLNYRHYSLPSRYAPQRALRAYTEALLFSV